MTFSIVACDLHDQSWGVAVASKYLAVGAVVPWAAAGTGAVATQAIANTGYGPRGLKLMAGGLTATKTLELLLQEDPERDHPQIGLEDANGQAATYTGPACHVWAEGITGEGYAIQGNLLTGKEVIEAMKQFLETAGSLPARLYAALL